MHRPDNLPSASNLGQMGPQAPSVVGRARTDAAAWRHVVLPPDHPVTRINASLLKTGLHYFQAVVFNQRGAITQVSGKKSTL